MMTSVDIAQRIRGEWAIAGIKGANQPARATLFISKVDVEGAIGKVNGAGGLSMISGDICQSAYTQIIY